METKSQSSGGNSLLRKAKASPSSDDFIVNSQDPLSSSKEAALDQTPPTIKITKSQNNSSLSNNSLEQMGNSNSSDNMKSPGKSGSITAKALTSNYMEKMQEALETILSSQNQTKDPVKLSKAIKSLEPTQESVLKSGKYKEWLGCEKNNEKGKVQIAFYCKWCRVTNQDIEFAKGVTFSDSMMLQSGFQTKMFKDHISTPQHCKAKELFLRETYSQDNDLTMILENQKDDYSVKLSNTIAMLLDLLKQNLSLEACLEVLKNAANRGMELSSNDISFVSMRELIKTMSDCRKEKTVQEINMSPYFSLILCPWPPSALSGTRSFEVVCYYIKQGVPKHAYFDTIVLRDAEYCGLLAYKRLITTLKKSGIEYQQKLVGLFTNGDLFFNGKNTGLSDLLKKEVSDIIAIHPLSYRYFTVSTQNYGITKAFPIVEHIFQLCLDTFHYFNSSQKTIKELFDNKAEIEELLADTSGSRNPGTKWSSLLSGILRIAKFFDKVYAGLKESKDFHGQGLEMHFRNPQYVAWIHFLADFGSYITNIGGVFREKTLSLRGKVKTLLGFKKKIMEVFLASDSGLSISEGFWADFKKNISEGNQYKDLKFSVNPENEKYEKDFRKFAEVFIEEVDRRYGNVYELESLGTFDLAFLKEKAKDATGWQVLIEKIKESGNKFLKELGKESFSETLAQELPGLVKYLKENCKNDSKATTLNELFSFCQEKFPVSIDLISRYYVLPLNLGDVEKSLRAFGRIQGRIKGSMIDDLVRAILMLNLHTDEGEEGKAMLAKYVEEWKKKVFVE